MTLNMTELEREVASDEGFMPTPYRCTAGKLSIGYGTNIQDGITRDEALLLMRHRLGKVVAAVSGAIAISFADAERLLLDQGEACFLHEVPLRERP